MSPPSGSTTDRPGVRSTEHRHGQQPWKPAVAAVARLVTAAGLVTLGLVAGVVTVTAHASIDVPVLLFAAVLTVGGTVLLALPRLRPNAGRAGRLAGGTTTLIGLALAAFLPVRRTCCDAAYTFSWGLPMPWITAGGDTPPLAYANMRAAPHETDTLSATADLLFWASTGLIVGAAVGMTRRTLRNRTAQRPL